MVQKLRDQLLSGPAGERPLTKEEMVALAEAVDLDTLDLGEFVHFQSKCYARNTVLLNEHAELAVICWEVGQQSSIHDHGDSLCLYLVTGGTMREEIYEAPEVEGGEPKRVLERDWHRGEITVAEGATIHRLTNPGKGGLVTIHIYSPPLDDRVTNFTPVPTYEGA
ncbi:MAG: cysteine dioxygenase [Planctomycetota bacterium]|jgi:cysteine dioxygenase